MYIEKKHNTIPLNMITKDNEVFKLTLTPSDYVFIKCIYNNSLI